MKYAPKIMYSVALKYYSDALHEWFHFKLKLINNFQFRVWWQSKSLMAKKANQNRVESAEPVHCKW